MAETDRAINAYYQAVSQDMAGNMGEQNAEEAELTHEEGMPPAYTEIAWQIMLNNERYVSVMLTARQFLGNAESEMVSADTFARDGLYAGPADYPFTGAWTGAGGRRAKHGGKHS